MSHGSAAKVVEGRQRDRGEAMDGLAVRCASVPQRAEGDSMRKRIVGLAREPARSWVGG